ncbi:hypothetical protein BGAL_0085g00040 [Botrytis galanthina]|uniref:RRM domain-containing protein n=1 Tax=Botrytis galanthina TaxID=278940 RepID=A0A4S8R7G5_9HELO|nr:hypothetical protein BGAL_0085g00040 [Botrytis galanthina]
MDITVSKSWYNGRPLPSETSSKNRKPQNKLVTGTRSSTSSKASDTTITARENPTPFRVSKNHVQRLEGLATRAEHDQDEENEFEIESQTLAQRFAGAMTLDESIKNSPPRRSRWHDMFESRHLMTAPQSAATNANRKKSPLSIFGNALPKWSPANGASNQMMGSKNVSTPSSQLGKTPNSKDAKKFKAFLNRGDGAVPFCISPHGAHQQFFPAPARHTRMTSASGSFVDKSQHTRIASASTGFGNFSYHPAIFEDEQMTADPMVDSTTEFSDFNRVAPEVLPVSMEYFTPSMAVTPTTAFTAQPLPMVMDNMMMPQVTIPDLSHLVKKFRPTNMLLREQGMIPDASRHDTNYEGDENHPDLLDLPEYINCCMWIINIPEEIGYAEFMQFLDCGAIAALSMVKPQNGHRTQAAKATFKTNAAGTELYRRARNKSGLRIRGRKIKVWYNDYGAYEWKGPETRFLEIEAPQQLDEAFWHGYFGSWCKYIIISVTPMPCRKYGFACTRFEFVRIAGQAQTCYQAIKKDMTFLGQVSVRYGIDPNEAY